MGHERIGYLPKTKRWLTIVDEIVKFSTKEDSIVQIANQTMKNIISRYKYIESDNGVLSSFKFLVLLSVAGKTNMQSDFLKHYNIDLPNNFSLLTLSKQIKEYVERHSDSKEYSSFASQALISTVSDWTKQNQKQLAFNFDSNENSYETWKKSANGAGFCELSRMFFTKFTEKYLKYFLEREAASNINNLFDRAAFNTELEKHLNQISRHAFETTKIVQSYSAGWFNKYTKEGIPTDQQIKDYLQYGFSKINSELVRERDFDK